MPSSASHVVADGRISFFFMADIHIFYIYTCMSIYFFIHTSTDGHLGCFYVWAAVNIATMNIEMQKFFQDSDFVSFR